MSDRSLPTPVGASDADTGGIVPLRIDTPFLVGAVNVWLIEDEPLTLVDTGPNTGTALLQLEEHLAERGHRLEDVGRIVVSHQHPDHAGLIGPLAARSGAEVLAVTGLDAWLRRGSASAMTDDRWSRDLMRAHGVPEAAVGGWWAARADTAGFASAAENVVPLADGDELAFAGRTLRVHAVPGHSPSDLLLEDRSRGLLIAGDHVLEHQLPMPLLAPALPGHETLAPDGTAERPRALLAFRASMRRTRELGAELALTGHGTPVRDVRANVDRRLAEQDRQAERLLDELRASGPGTAYELAVRTARRGRPSNPFFGLCTTLGTLDQLVDERAALAAPGDGPPRYEAR